MITIVDYGLGNLNSIKNMLHRLGYASMISSDPEEIDKAEKLILPGVGAFDHGMRNIRERSLEGILNKKVINERVPTLGICLGMQLLAESSEEGSEPGLGWISGRAIRFKFDKESVDLKVPHMGWNTVKVEKDCELSCGFLPEMRFYFVHSYHVVCKHPEDIFLTAEYGIRVVAAIQRDNIMGTQFHPEKSHKFGMMLLSNFAEIQSHA
jgi:imidazole glycerol-phosphate synthase subunit HisH